MPEHEEGDDGAGVSRKLAIPGAITFMHMPSLDKHVSGRFYEGVFGWRNVNEGDSFEDRSGHLRGAWSSQIPVAEAGGPLLFIWADDVDLTIEKVIEFGGELAAPPFKEGELNVATFRDPSGNVLGIWNGPVTR